MSEALARVSQVKHVPVALARALGLHDDEDSWRALDAAGEGAVEIPCWRHAIINFPHPLLQQGLVILDTPGLNAIGTEPELTLNLLPNAHAVSVHPRRRRRRHQDRPRGVEPPPRGRRPAQQAGPHRDPEQDRRPVGRAQDRRRGRRRDRPPGRRRRRALLGLPPSQVFAVSAQKALLAKVNGDDALLEQSRLPALEDALSRKLIPGEARHRRRGDAGRGPRRSPPACARCSRRARPASPSSSPSCARCAARTRTSSST